MEKNLKNIRNTNERVKTLFNLIGIGTAFTYKDRNAQGEVIGLKCFTVTSQPAYHEHSHTIAFRGRLGGATDKSRKDASERQFYVNVNSIDFFQFDAMDKLKIQLTENKRKSALAAFSKKKLNEKRTNK